MKQVRKLVVKVGTTVLLGKEGGIDSDWVSEFSRQVADLVREKRQVVIVSSGAIACGMHLLRRRRRPSHLPEEQAAAALGQARLMAFYDDAFRRQNLKTAQLLLTQADLLDQKRRLNARHTLTALLEFGAIPIVNENDTVATDEIRFGDNDRLSSLVACLFGADLLVLLSDVDGFYRHFEKGALERLTTVEAITPEIERHIRNRRGPFSKGGMASKLMAAKIATQAGIWVLLAHGHTPHLLNRLLEGEEGIGTLFLPSKKRMGFRRSWIAFNAPSLGRLVVDEGAKNALLHLGKSLLPSGIRRVEGRFGVGEVAAIVDEAGFEFARGLTNYSSEEVEKIRGTRSDRIESILGYKTTDEVIHRDNMAVL